MIEDWIRLVNKSGTSPAKLTELLQIRLNETAAAQNYELESKTVGTFDLIQKIGEGLPRDNSGLSDYYLLFNAWIRWLCNWDHYALNLLHRRRLIGYLNRYLGEGRFKLEIYPYTSRLYNIMPSQRSVEIRLHEAMDFMSDSYCQKLAKFTAERRWRELRQLFRDYQASEPRYKELLDLFRNIKANREPVNNTQGRFYDLEEVFRNCNQHNFGGKMPRPRGLTWSKRVNHSTMGTYNLNEDTVTINRGLDRRDVPAYVTDFIMYHELLHKLLGIKTVGSRRHAHTPEFRKLEQAHPQYQQAQDFLKKNSSGL